MAGKRDVATDNPRRSRDLRLQPKLKSAGGIRAKRVGAIKRMRIIKKELGLNRRNVGEAAK